MEAWLTYPEVQSAAVPFILAIIIALVLRGLGGTWSSWGVIVGLGAAAYLITGFQFTPLNSTRKILAVATAATAIGLAVEILPWRRGLMIAVAAAGAGAAVWVLWPLLIRESGGWAWWQGALAAGYVALSCAAAEFLRSRFDGASIALSAYALGTGGAALLGATALYGQLGLAAGAASGAAALLTLLGGAVIMSRVVTYPVMALCGLLGVGAIAYSTLPFYCVIPLLLIPWVAAIPRKAELSPRIYRIVLAALMGALAAVALAIAWKMSGPPPF